MTAKEAREKADFNRQSRNKTNYERTLKEIIEVVNQGGFILYMSNIEPGTKEILQTDGYKVEYIQSGPNEYEYKISW